MIRIFQCNLFSWTQRGSDLVKLADQEGVSVILVQVQETLLKEHEAATVARSLKDWHFYHQTEQRAVLPCSSTKLFPVLELMANGLRV